MWGGEGYATVEGCTFQDNSTGTSVVVLFGAHNPDADFTALVEDCTFTRNSAENNTLWLAHTGASGSLRVSDCSFEDNTGWQGYGGTGLEIDLRDGASAMVSGCSFVDNEAMDREGGALALDLHGDASLGEITDCSFEYNTAQHGGAIDIEFLEGAPAAGIYDSTFTANVAWLGGGAIRHNHRAPPDGRLETLVLDGCSFTGNSVGDVGGAIYGDAGETAISFLDCSFESNNAVWASVYGPDAGDEQAALDLVIADSSFVGNSSTYGGAFDFCGMPQAALDIQDSHFEGNTNSSCGAGDTCYAAAIDISHSVHEASLTLARTSFHGNNAAGLAAVGVTSGTELQADEVDWGTGSLDNSPADLCVGQSGNYACNADLGASESFECPGDGSCDW